jgi:signal transduction histidine kinase
VVDLAAKSGRSFSDVSVVFHGDEGLAVKADGAQVRQLIWNLVRNAVQASNAGGTVSVSIEGVDGNVLLAVKDDGVGIEPDAMARLFDAFYTTRSHGTGIGLAVVKRIADDHGFSVDVKSAPGGGTTFRVNLGPRQPLSGELALGLPQLRSVTPPSGTP